MPRLSLYREQKQNDYRFLDRNISEQLTVGGTDLYIHNYNVPIIGWSGVNKYYIDKNGFAIRAEQDLHPFLPRFKIDYFYKFD